jgi:D-glucosaminate-6-phosphate ammonia-lyase
VLQMLDMDDHFELWDPPPELIDKRRLPGLPRHGIGRGFKVSKEEIVALLTALDLFVRAVYDEDLPRYRRILDSVTEHLTGTDAACRIVESDPDRWPLLVVDLDEKKSGRTAVEVCRRLRNGDPPIYVGHGQLKQGRLIINPVCLSEEQADRLGQRLRQELVREQS